ncbi:MAG: hypothetical protein OXF89_04445 [Rhodospirillaceae bacterium]|nr:hypothetical protein [Rhodospirillaceae bacterium]
MDPAMRDFVLKGPIPVHQSLFQPTPAEIGAYTLVLLPDNDQEPIEVCAGREFWESLAAGILHQFEKLEIQ